jgi:hypothetical protein
LTESDVTSANREQEAQWKAELEKIGETAVRQSISLNSGVGIGIGGEPMRQYAFRWLREKEQQRQERELSTNWYVKWTFYAAVAAVVMGILGVIVTLLH